MYFDPEKYDFWPIYDCIRKYYPIGLDKDFNLHFNSPGYNELIEIITDNIHDDNNYQSRWEVFCKELEKEFSKEIVGTTYGQLPCFSAYVILDEKLSDGLLRTKHLYFFVSLLGPFFSIIGRDGSRVKYEQKYRHWITNYITVSPENEYAETFNALELRIAERFTSHRFVPFYILEQKIESLYTKCYDENTMTVFNCLFNDQIDAKSNISGKIFYGSDKWIRKDYDSSKEGGWTIYPPQV